MSMDKSPEIEIRRSSRKTISLQITRDMRLIVRAPNRMSKGDVQKFIQSHASWIEKHMARIAAQNNQAAENVGDSKLSDTEISVLKEQARNILPAKAEHFAPLIGAAYNRISIRCQSTRWGSCSAKGNLNFNCLLMLTPEEVQDYVVVHELCHLKELNHSPRFWAEVEKVLPDYRERRQWLKQNGSAVMARAGK